MTVAAPDAGGATRADALAGEVEGTARIHGGGCLAALHEEWTAAAVTGGAG